MGSRLHSSLHRTESHEVLSKDKNEADEYVMKIQISSLDGK